MSKRMPALIGGFGKINIKTIMNKEFSTESNKEEKDENKLDLRSKIGCYLAGLIESDGSIAVHNENSAAKRYCPKILIVFNIADEPLANKLAFITGTGTVYKKKDAGYIL